MTIMLFTHSIDVMFAIVFGIGALTTLRVNIGYIWLMELLPKKHQTTVGAGFNVISGFTVIMGATYFKFISKNWLYLVLVGYTLNFIALVTCFFLPESPRLLLALNRTKEAYNSLQWIAKWNRQTLDWNDYDMFDKLAKDGSPIELEEDEFNL